jgi:GxxExxY protein
MAEIYFKELSYQIVGSAMEVHNTLGPGFLETVYQAALAREFELRKIVFEPYKRLPVCYKDIQVGDYIADFLVEDAIILEIKAASQLHPRHTAQALNYLAATGKKLAIIINFGAPKLQTKRVLR